MCKISLDCQYYLQCNNSCAYFCLFVVYSLTVVLCIYLFSYSNLFIFISFIYCIIMYVLIQRKAIESVLKSGHMLVTKDKNLSWTCFQIIVVVNMSWRWWMVTFMACTRLHAHGNTCRRARTQRHGAGWLFAQIHSRCLSLGSGLVSSLFFLSISHS